MNHNTGCPIENSASMPAVVLDCLRSLPRIASLRPVKSTKSWHRTIRLLLCSESGRRIESGCVNARPAEINASHGRVVAVSDSAARGPWRSGCASLRVRPIPAPAVSGTVSKPNETPRKYQSGPSSCAATASGKDGDSNGVED
jgi:hypothetical protein